jgi:uncharacterized protein YcnI
MIARILLAVIAATMVCAPVFAHVTVWPRDSRPGAYEKYVVRVPTEGAVATTSVELIVPQGVAIVSMGAPAPGGFTYELKRTGDRVTSIVWTMQIKPGEFAEFPFMARNPKGADEIVWKAVQHFSDGTSTQWAGPKSDKNPAPVVRLSDKID